MQCSIIEKCMCLILTFHGAASVGDARNTLKSLDLDSTVNALFLQVFVHQVW